MSPMMPPMPIERFLVAERSPGVPNGFIRIRHELTRGVPFELPLASDLSLVLLVPTGAANVWRDLDPVTVVSAGIHEIQSHDSLRGADPLEQLPVRLLLREGPATLATIPLAAGLSRVIPDGDNARTLVDLFIAGWLLHAGCVRGPGDYGSFVDVGWRRADKGVNAHALAPMHPHVSARNPALARSTIGIPGTTSTPRGGYLP